MEKTTRYGQTTVRIDADEIMARLQLMDPEIPRGAIVSPRIDPITEEFKGLDVVWDDVILARTSR